jgi:hypothetical protein
MACVFDMVAGRIFRLLFSLLLPPPSRRREALAAAPTDFVQGPTVFIRGIREDGGRRDEERKKGWLFVSWENRRWGVVMMIVFIARLQ